MMRFLKYIGDLILGPPSYEQYPILPPYCGAQPRPMTTLQSPVGRVRDMTTAPPSLIVNIRYRINQ